MGYLVSLSERIERTGRPSQAFNVLRSVVAALVHPTTPALKNAASIPLTLIGLGCVVSAVFLLNVIAGLMVLGPVLILIEHILADE